MEKVDVKSKNVIKAPVKVQSVHAPAKVQSKAPAKVESKVWTRVFASGTRVVVDFNHMNATIAWAGGAVVRS